MCSRYVSVTTLMGRAHMSRKLFAVNLGDEYIPSTLPTENGALYWSISRSSTAGDLYIKVRSSSVHALPVLTGVSQIVNPTSSSEGVVFDLAFSNVASTGTLQLLHGAQNDSNTPATQGLVTPQASTINTGKTFTYTVPSYSVGVITVAAS